MARSPYLDFPDDFAPEPTVLNGGPDRQKQIWEACRKVNAGGYGSGVVQTIKSMGCQPNAKQVTSCSPFTATAIGMMFDKRPGVEQSNFEPMYDNGTKPLGHAFYQMHNGTYFAIDHDSAADEKRTTARSAARLTQWAQNNWPTPARAWDDSAMACVWYNLGYQIDPRDMRRGDLVGVDWSPSNGGHAVFVWDVHLDGGGAVDCFTFLSSNGTSAHGGVGISVYCYPPTSRFFDYDKSKGTYSQKVSPTFKDNDLYTQFGAWHTLPTRLKQDIDLKTFNQPISGGIIDAHSFNPKYGGPEYVGSLRVVRFWGIAPPDRPHGTLLGDKSAQAHQLTKWQPPEPNCMGSSKPSEGRIENIAPTPVAKSHPDPIKAVPPKPAPPQKKEQAVAHQHFVEAALGELYDAKWIDVHPGAPDSVGDPKTKAAVEDFQKKFKVPPIDGIAGQKTRPAIEQALADFRAGKPNPNKPPPPPAIDRFYWLSNRVAPGGVNGVAIVSPTFDGFQTFEVTLEDQRKKSVKVPLPLATFNGRGVCAVAIPADFPAGSVLTAHLRGMSNGTPVDKTTSVPLYVGGVVAPSQDDWPWDESKWNDYMRGVLAELRATPKGPGNLTQREITQYGVKESLKPGTVQIMGKVGKNVVPLPLPPVDKLGLYLSDIEGTLRWQGRVLNIVKSGNVYDKPVTRVINGVTVTKMKPTLEKFDPANSLWVDVTEHHPWGSGARMPLIPFRVLAHNAKTEPSLYGRIVYIQQLDGLVLPTGETHNGMCIVGDQGGMAPPGKQFDFCVGREDRHIQIPTLAPSQGGSVCNVEILGPCAAYSKPHK
jgi:peptidoglycan hydrolase-like protein with peptidoglycan-binding domain